MNGLAASRASDCLTSWAGSRKDSCPPGTQTRVGLDLCLELIVGEGEHAAVGVVDEHDLAGAEQPLADDQRANLILGDDSAGIADHVRVALAEPQQPVGVQACIHARDDRDVAGGRHGQVALVEGGGVGAGVVEQVVGNAHEVVASGSVMVNAAAPGRGQGRTGTRADGRRNGADQARGIERPALYHGSKQVSATSCREPVQQTGGSAHL
jgi:hypothetical protein